MVIRDGSGRISWAAAYLDDVPRPVRTDAGDQVNE